MKLTNNWLSKATILITLLLPLHSALGNSLPLADPRFVCERLQYASPGIRINGAFSSFSEARRILLSTRKSSERSLRQIDSELKGLANSQSHALARAVACSRRTAISTKHDAKQVLTRLSSLKSAQTELLSVQTLARAPPAATK